MWDFFQRKVCLTLGPDWPAAEAQFARIGLQGVQKFQAVPIDNNGIPGPHQSFSASVRKALVEFNESPDERMLFLEDDCYFLGVDHVETALCELPDDWDVVYLGANLINGQPLKYSERLHRVDHAWTTHAIGFNKKVVPFLLENQPGFSEEMFDCWLAKQLPNLNAFVVNPMCAYQRPHESTIWGRFDDYTPIFEESQRMLV